MDVPVNLWKLVLFSICVFFIFLILGPFVGTFTLLAMGDIRIAIVGIFSAIPIFGILFGGKLAMQACAIFLFLKWLDAFNTTIGKWTLRSGFALGALSGTYAAIFYELSRNFPVMQSFNAGAFVLLVVCVVSGAVTGYFSGLLIRLNQYLNTDAANSAAPV